MATGGAATGGAATGGAATGGSSAITPDNLPFAFFTVSPTSATAAVLDANGSWDLETPAANLLLRWDFENDGVWDTDYSTTRVLTHDFGVGSSHTIRLSVKDSSGQTSELVRTAQFGAITYVSGTLCTTTWSGTVVVQNDVLVSAGCTLTIAAGTNVLFTYLPGGLAGLQIDGTLNVNGTSDSPVLFSSYGIAKRTPSAWDGIYVRGAATITGAIVEDATQGLRYCTATNASVTDSVFEQNDTGITATCSTSGTLIVTGTTLSSNATNGAQLTYGTTQLQRVTAENNAQAGVVGSQNAVISVATSTFRGNKSHGIFLDANTTTSSSFSAISSTFRDNGGAGLDMNGSSRANVSQSDFISNNRGIYIEGCAALSVTTSNFRNHPYEAVLIDITSCASTSPITINYCNFTDNARLGALVNENPNLSDSSSTVGTHSATYSTPAGESILKARVGYSVSTYGTGSGILYDGNGVQLWSTSTASSATWIDISAKNVSSVYCFASGGTDWPVYVGVSGILYRKSNFPADLSVLVARTVNASQNYWKNSPPVVFSVSPSTLDVSNAATSPVAAGP